MGKAKKLAWVVVVLAVCAGGVYAWRRASPERKAEPRFETRVVDRGPIVAKVTASGTLSALVTVQVGSQVSGRIKALNADFNSEVRQGDTIATIDPQLFEAAIEQGRANLLAAQGDQAQAVARAREAERQARRARELAERKLLSQADLEAAEANAAALKAVVLAAGGRVAQARAALHQSEVNLAYTNIVAPISGVVISRAVDVGQTVAASFQSPVLFTIAEDLHRMQVDTSVAEADVGKLDKGMAASFTVDAYPSERFRGTVRQIRNAAQTVQNVVTYDAVIDVENPELKLRPGMTANVTFVYAEKADVLRVPNSALRFRPSSELLASARASQGPAGAVRAEAGPAAPGGKTVWLLREGRPEALPVRIGITDGSLTEVLDDGLKVGDAVIVDAPSSSPSFGPPRGPRIF
jgi:HlyD family secretion protein